MDDPEAANDIIWELRAAQHPERVDQLTEMLEAHLDAVRTAINMREEPAAQAQLPAPELGANPAYQIETAQTSLPRPVINFLEAFFRINNIDSHPENILEEGYRDLLENITREERGTLWELTPRQRDEALSHVITVIENMGLNVDSGDFEPDTQHGANQPAQLRQGNEAHRDIRRVINNTLDRLPDMNQMYNQMIDDEIQQNTPIESIIEMIRSSAATFIADIQNNPRSMGFDPDMAAGVISDLQDLNSHLNNLGRAQAPAQLPAPAPQDINAAVVRAFTEPLQLATTPSSYRLMNNTVADMNALANTMFGHGYNASEIAQSAIYRLTNRRNDVVRSTPEVLRIDRSAYDDYLSLLRTAIDDLGPYAHPQQQAQLPAPAQPQVADADVLPRHIQTMAMGDIIGNMGVRLQDEVTELADEYAGPNNGNTPTDLRQLANFARIYRAGYDWADFTSGQREYLARLLEQHATDIERRQQP
jgi:hypothetical protein